MVKLKLWASLILVGAMLLMTMVGLFYTPHPANVMDIEHRLEGPSAQFLLGTDNYGRDVFSRIMVGGRPAFQAGMMAVCWGFFRAQFWGLWPATIGAGWEERA